MNSTHPVVGLFSVFKTHTSEIDFLIVHRNNALIFVYCSHSSLDLQKEPSTKTDILLERTLISNIMADQAKTEKPTATKNLIASFEKGEISQNSVKEGAEKPLARPGAAKKLQQVYEDKSKPEPTPAIAKTSSGKKGAASPVSPTSKKPSRNVLVVFAHWEKKSFNGRQLERMVKTLEKAGHKVTVSDLYAMKWNPCPSQADLKGMLW